MIQFVRLSVNDEVHPMCSIDFISIAPAMLINISRDYLFLLYKQYLCIISKIVFVTLEHGIVCFKLKGGTLVFSNMNAHSRTLQHDI